MKLKKILFRIPRIFFLLCLFFSLWLFFGCNDDDHNVDKNGVMHKEGLYEPHANCDDCHGGDLKGRNPSIGETAPSCYDCHGQKW